jgi:hypothetical protein
MRGRNALLICASVGPVAGSGKAGSAVKQLTLAVAGVGTVRQVVAGSPEFCQRTVLEPSSCNLREV